jgi:hypothetical protein
MVRGIPSIPETSKLKVRLSPKLKVCTSNSHESMEICAMRRPVMVIILFLFTCFMMLSYAYSLAGGGQTVVSGALIGRVTDPSGAAIPNAAVTVVNISTGVTQSVVATNDGMYSIQGLTPGSYTLTAKASNFITWVRQSVTIGGVATQNITMQVGSASTTVSVSVDPPPGSSQVAFVQVGVNGVLGPMGYVATPTLTSANQMSGVDTEAMLAAKNFNFPSIVLYISSAPLVYAPADVADQSQLDKIKSTQETTANPLWLDATFTIIPKDANGIAIPNACRDGSIQVLGILPQQTTGGTKTSTQADVAGGINDAAGALASFYPGESNLVSSATKALNVVFGDIFPPKPIAYQYSYMHGDCNFGWFFRPNTSGSGSGPASILGLQTGIVLLKTTKNIRSIGVTGVTLSEWSKAPSTYSKKLFSTTDTLADFVLPSGSSIDFNDVYDLSAFPALIAKPQAMKITHISSETDWQTLVKTAPLVTTPAGDYVTNASLAAFLGMKQPPSATSQQQQSAVSGTQQPAGAAPKTPQAPGASLKPQPSGTKQSSAVGKGTTGL